MKHERHNPATRGKVAASLVVAGLTVGLAGCNSSPFGNFSGFNGFSGSFYDGKIQRGYVVDTRTVEGLKPGLSKEQVLSQLGTPSTTSTVGGDAWYYISQTVNRSLAFMPDRVTDQRVMAVYFGKGARMERVANYGLQDGRLFDYMSRTTPVAGGDSTFVQNMIRSLLKFS